MIISLTGFSALVCGASQGIGLAAAKALASAGADVTLVARNVHKLEDTLSQLDTSHGQKHVFLSIDLSKTGQALETVTQHLNRNPGFHILVNNAGGPPPGAIVDASSDDFLQAIQTHLLTSHGLVKLVLPFMKQHGYGRIINVISTSVKVPIAGLGVSNTTRAAMAGWSKTLALEVASFGITVNNVLPGFTQTPRLDSLIETRASNAGISTLEYADKLREAIPAKRFGQPEEPASLIAFLASPHAGYINGANIPVDGGNTGAF